MIKYFISYEDFIEEKNLNKELNILSPELNIIRKKGKGEYRIQPLMYFSNLVNNIDKFVVPSNYDKKGMLLVELTKEESEKVNPLLVKKFEYTLDGTYKKILEEKDPKEINLISYNCLVGINAQEMDLGYIVSVMPCKSDSSKFYISADRSKLLDNTTNNRRETLRNKEIGCDLYFYTENEVLLDRYSNDITTLTRVEPDKYELTSTKVFIIDSIPQNRIYELNAATRRCFYDLCNLRSIPVNIIRDDDDYELTIHDVDRREKKGYIITNNNLKNILCDSAIEPLLNYINVYELSNGKYKKIPIVEYVNKTNTIKLNFYKNKKPSN